MHACAQVKLYGKTLVNTPYQVRVRAQDSSKMLAGLMTFHDKGLSVSDITGVWFRVCRSVSTSLMSQASTR
jgi:hypothetical protein